MLITVTNTSGVTINTPKIVDGATGGMVTKPLPRPFSWIGPLAAAGTKQLVMGLSDLSAREYQTAGFTAREEFETMVKAGEITLTIADQAGAPSLDEKFVIEMGN
jgi:hypothetical protein